jgi:predicted ester cyclase
MERDGVIMKKYTITGTHEGEFRRIPPSDRTIESTGMAKIVVEDGEIREDRLYFDRMEPMEQLGVLNV